MECFYVVEGWMGFDERTRQGVVKVRANIYFAEFLGRNRLIGLSRSNPRSYVGMDFLESIKTRTERSIIWQSRISWGREDSTAICVPGCESAGKGGYLDGGADDCDGD